MIILQMSVNNMPKNIVVSCFVKFLINSKTEKIIKMNGKLSEKFNKV